MITFKEFLDQIIETGIESAEVDYARPGREKGKMKLEGSIAGFEACRNKNDYQLTNLLKEAISETRMAMMDDATDYWYWRARQAEIEWVCNCVSVVLINEGHKPIVVPTARAVLHSVKIMNGLDA